ncbi:homoprotocatechuate degradation operon regulator HpaR [Aliiroseovarius sp. M344]|uniref:homoprotocatechuate degradation operon regulator HpaR n=1 Tax=Aliiroseovarius sp. M344 TaxID=2867010 RepID=UPI0021AD5FCB|nr:homoprotocatechuate degradation operon regulator HpaR [Aliiroseovarius sp. M344]UWQ15404.1 homoprotocatechuate degradation operon regulator HpaR [Aliiroseovarius sp. M344]
MSNSTKGVAGRKLPSTRRSLPIALMRAREKVMGPVREMLAHTGITEQQWRILRVLSEYGPQDATHLGERTSLLLPSLTRIIQSMVANGLVTRTQDENDRRRQTLAITTAGQQIIDDNLEEARRIAETFVRHLGEEQYETLLDALEALESL